MMTLLRVDIIRLHLMEKLLASIYKHLQLLVATLISLANTWIPGLKQNII